MWKATVIKLKRPDNKRAQAIETISSTKAEQLEQNRGRKERSRREKARKVTKK